MKTWKDVTVKWKAMTMPIKSGIKSTHSSSILSSDIIKEIGLVPPHGCFFNK